MHLFSEIPWLITRNLLVAQISIAYVWIRIFGYASSSMTECRPGPTLSQTAQMCQSLFYTHKHTTKHTQTQTDIESNITIAYKHGKQHKQIMPRKPCTMKTKNTFQSNFSSWIISQIDQALCKTPPLITDVRMRQWYQYIGFFAWMPWPLFLVIYCYH